MAKKSTTAKMREYLTVNPAAKAADVAAKFKVSKAHVYVTRSQLNKKLNDKNFKSIDDQVQELLNKPSPINVDATLVERGKRYGTFKGHAEVTYKLKNILRAHADKMQRTFAFDQAEAMDMICHKLGRIVNGDPDYVDSWVDIAGYAKLVADRLEGKEV